MSACRSCGARILWARSEHDRPMPFDFEPYTGDDARGLFVLRRMHAQAPTALAVPPDAFPDEPRYRSHFATCPNADEHRRRKT